MLVVMMWMMMGRVIIVVGVVMMVLMMVRMMVMVVIWKGRSRAMCWFEEKFIRIDLMMMMRMLNSGWFLWTQWRMVYAAVMMDRMW